MGVRLGRYEVRTRLARGGMAEIYLAVARGPEGFAKTVVIKRLLPHLAENPQIVSMFLEEARLAAELQHPHIVQIFELGQQDGDHFICMEYLAGKDLAAILTRAHRRGTPLPVEIAAQIASCIAQGLHYAHRQKGPDRLAHGIVHGDISPSNVVVTFVGEVKIVDFGIARAAGAVQTAFPGALQGKLAYLAPEQIARGQSDCRADIFALGVVTHELLTGERLFRRENDAATIEAIVRERIPDPRLKRPDIPDRLAAIVMRALEQSPDRRFQTADEMRLGLDTFLSERTWMPTSARLSAFLTELFGEEDARRALSGPAPEPTATVTAAEAPLALPGPVRGVPAVPLVAEPPRRGPRPFVRVVGEVPAALLKASQGLFVAVPLHVVQYAQRWTRKRLVAAALALALGGFAAGTMGREIREAAVSAAQPTPPPALRAASASEELTWNEDVLEAFLEQTLAPPPRIGHVAPLEPRPLEEPQASPALRRAHRRPGTERHGRLVLAARGTVFFGGARLGEAPLARRMPPGSYDVTLLDPAGRQRTWIAVVRPGRTTRLALAP